MAEVRCPMCGKPNPDDLEVCQYCQARLKPLIISSSPEEPSEEGASTPPEEEAYPEEKTPEIPPTQPDWLQPDWLQSLRRGGATDELGEQGEPEPEEPPDWAEDEAGEETAQEPEIEGLTAPEEPPKDTDWLDSLRPRTHIEREEPKQPQEEIPEWLERIRSRQKSEESVPPPADVDDETEEFLAGLRSKPSSEEKPPSEPVSLEIPERRLDEDAEIPDWLADFTSDELEGKAETPDWQKGEDFPAITEKPGEEFHPRPAGPISEEPPISEILPEVEEPDWLADLEKSAGLDEGDVASTGEEGEAIPEWLESLEEESPLTEESADQGGEEKAAPASTSGEESAGPAGEELPEWLEGASPPETPAEINVPPEAEEGLTPAELPTWLESMRPVEAAVPSAPSVEERDRMIESSGPLAGLRGILPAEPDVAVQKKAPTYSVKLQVSESQQSHADILTEIVKSEGITPPVPRAPVISSQVILRIVIFLILLASILYPALVGELGTPLPEIPTEIIQASNIVNAVPQAANVLLAVDYQPGFSGELDAAAASVIDNLMIKGAYLTLVSTFTNGPAQAEHLIRSVNQQSGHQYLDINQYANLGYIAGGTSGLRSFVEAPRQIMPYALDGSTVWADGRLAGINTLSDFNLVIVITESPDAARNWVEQVEPMLEDTPLLMVVSAQLEPLVRPYYEAYPQQVDGLVAGLSAGVSYESILQRPGLAHRFWDAFSFGLPTAVILILIGSLVSIIVAYLPVRKRDEGVTK